MAKTSKSFPVTFEEVLAEGLRIQHRFRPEPIYKTTGKGYMAPAGVEEMAAAKKALEQHQATRSAKDKASHT